MIFTLAKTLPGQIKKNKFSLAKSLHNFRLPKWILQVVKPISTTAHSCILDNTYFINKSKACIHYFYIYLCIPSIWLIKIILMIQTFWPTSKPCIKKNQQIKLKSRKGLYWNDLTLWVSNCFQRKMMTLEWQSLFLK